MIGKTIDRYHILEKLGEGGMATVYKAYDTRLEADVAVKIIRTERLAPDVLQRSLKRFEREAKALARLTHPNIVKVTDYGEYQGQPYLVMPFLPGGTLKNKLERPMSWQEAARLLVPVAKALDYAHRQGMIHRDIKTSNILITEDGQPMLSDFGVAKIIDVKDTVDLTGTGMGVGTPEYMAPEQFHGQADERTDVYALGIVFYEMLAGRKPYQVETPAALIIKQATDPLPRPSGFVDGLPANVEKVLIKALAKEPENRYVSMVAFAKALEKVTLRSAEIPIRPSEDPDLTYDDFAITPPGGESQTKEPKTHNVSSQLRAIPVWGWIAVVGVIIIFALAILIGRGSDEVGPFAWIATETATAMPTATATPGAIPIPTLGVEPTQKSEIDGMVQVYIPAGEFQMGSQDGNSDEELVHTVYLDAFWMDQTEVTNAMYEQCVNVGACSLPNSIKYFGDQNYINHPVVYVSWYGAKAYCEWAGRRLPTEAEWEKAARGGLEGQQYPWGNIDPVCTPGSQNGAKFDDNAGCDDTSTEPVMSYHSNGYGLYDMAGNVWEWVHDLYDGNYYSNSPSINPESPSFGDYRVLRGGSWFSSGRNLRSANWFFNNPDDSSSKFGFRCVRSP